ncbi:TonB-dependent receptor domain-containing protein [Brevundimonas variabilis]|uniref:Outer membrane receptor protein involved in Fe transport n=1 Tax=Brevundimonas variabilis TaxID=74312 RepID=A0A7W9CJF8_9CAUL|nr:TonB-dependent receptor [Brevundimonas variabilis]MBB5746805.1 outer membrane receptor protein involved in Fe transport [Brevundimonas variabilis]
MVSTRKYLFGTTVLAGILSMAAPAFAQTAPAAPQDDEAVVDEIVVTGSRIRRDPASVPTPIITVQREALLETGLATVIDYLATIPALSNSLVPSDTTGNNLNDGGLEFANLRSLGSGRTLTLIDGRRHVGSQAGTLQVDVSIIPRLLIESIDIVTGGASSVYGADAVSGVLNYTLRKDFEGLEIDANYGQLVQEGDANTRRVSVLAGKNFFDDRLNIYAHAEYEKADEVYSEYINWLADGRITLGIDADPANATLGPINDGFIDIAQFYGARRLDRPRWGSTTLANMQRPSPLSDPDVTFADCPGGSSTAAGCFNVDPAYTYWFDGTTARLANFGQRIGTTGTNRPWNIGGDGETANVTTFDQRSRFPEQESQRYQVGLNFKITDSISALLEAKYTTEDAFDVGQASFWDIYITDAGFGGTINTGTGPGLISGTSAFTTRLDNAFLPANLRAAIQNNTFTRYNNASAATPNDPGSIRTVGLAAPIAIHRGFGIDRNQTNNREVQRYVAALEGAYDKVGFVDNFAWSASYTYGEMNNINREAGPDAIRFAHAMDSVVDTAGIVNGRPGEIVCRVRLLAARGLPIAEQNPNTAATTYASATNPEIAGCVPLNVFGAGNQSAEALNYFSTSIAVRQKNIQESAVASVSGQLWDFWGAGPIGVALGLEYRREFTEGVGRSRDTAGRVLQLNTGADLLGVEYETEEAFAEIAIPLLRDSWLGEFAELSGSYRTFDYTTAGSGDVYGVNLVYRPITDITFKSSFNTSFRAPNLSENFTPLSQTFVNAFVDPCSSTVIANFSGADAATVRANRIANCTTLARARGLNYDFGQTTPTPTDDYLPVYPSGIASSSGGNPTLTPETSESFTFSTVLRPRFVPNLSIVLDYYEIEVANVIVTPSGQFLADDCVSAGPTLNQATCQFVFRNNPTTGDAFDVFKVGAGGSDPVGGFILAPVNRAKLQTRGLDFSINYGFDSEDLFGVNLGRFDYTLSGLWLIEQKNFLDPTNPAAFTDSTTSVFFPRLEGVSRLSWSPNDKVQVSWTLDWLGSQDLAKTRDILATGNLDGRPVAWNITENFYRHDFSVRYNLTDDITLRAGVTNAFDAEPPPYLGFASTFDPYGRRFNVGINFRAF